MNNNRNRTIREKENNLFPRIDHYIMFILEAFALCLDQRELDISVNDDDDEGLIVPFHFSPPMEYELFRNVENFALTFNIRIFHSSCEIFKFIASIL